MMKNVSRLIGAGLIAGLMAACSSDQRDADGIVRVIGTTLKGAVETRRAGPPKQVVVTPEMFAKIEVPMIQVNPVTLGGSDFLQRAAMRRDSGKGTLEIWKSSDNAQIFLRNGVVVGTRGIGRDIIAADAAVTVSALRNRASRSGIRTFTISDGDVTSNRIQFRCDIVKLGPEKINVVNHVFTTDHFRETCVSAVAGGQSLRNEYWVQQSTGIVRKSRQWIGPVVGYFDMVLLRS